MGGPPYWSVVEDLVKLLKQHHQYDNLQNAVEQAVAYNIAELKKIGIVDRESFLDCMDFLVRTWTPSEDLEGKDVYYRLIIHYSIFDQPVLKNLQSPIKPTSAHRPLSWLLAWLVQYAKEMGKLLDQESSLTAESLKTFFESPLYNMNE